MHTQNPPSLSVSISLALSLSLSLSSRSLLLPLSLMYSLCFSLFLSLSIYFHFSHISLYSIYLSISLIISVDICILCEALIHCCLKDLRHRPRAPPSQHLPLTGCIPSHCNYSGVKQAPGWNEVRRFTPSLSWPPDSASLPVSRRCMLANPLPPQPISLSPLIARCGNRSTSACFSARSKSVSALNREQQNGVEPKPCLTFPVRHRTPFTTYSVRPHRATLYPDMLKQTDVPYETQIDSFRTQNSKLKR
jgi:hypothetical protein